jgi:hypothetical protein
VQISQVMHSPGGAETKAEFLCRCYVRNGEQMDDIQNRFAVFFGKVDRRPRGWYWTIVPNVELTVNRQYAGPFETKANAIEDAALNGAGSLH